MTMPGGHHPPPLTHLVHDPLPDDDPEMTRAAAEIALLRLENERLADRLNRSLEQLAESRARLLEVSNRERRRIERDIHDGAQQGLVNLRIRLSVLQERLAAAGSEHAVTLAELAQAADGAIDQLRALAHGVYPPLLSEHGLSQALQSAARSSPVATTLDVHQSTRYEEAVETSIYFACLEALQNAAKHASGATAVHVRVFEDSETVRFEVRDDGEGFDGGPTDGSGLANIRERLAAAGGSLSVSSTRGEGTVVAGEVPMRPAPPRRRLRGAAPDQREE